MINRFIRYFIFGIILCSLLSCSEPAKLKALDNNATVLAFGDSLTYGTGTSRDKAYPAVLEKLINRKVINAGIPGEISREGLQRLPGLLEKHQPELVIICHGGNDILKKYDLKKTQDNLQQMINLARKNNAEVVLISVPEFGLFLSPAPIYQALAEVNHIPISSNILSDIIKKNALKSDHIHPNAQGYQLLAKDIAALLRQSGAIAAQP